MSMYTGRGCPAQCTFCLWPQSIGGHKYRVRSAQNVAEEMAYAKKYFRRSKNSSSTTTPSRPTSRARAKSRKKSARSV
jgi:radical SAM superfamily enzyme YgiQ (UPF0313 family)